MDQAHVIRPDQQFWNPYTDRIENKWAAFEVGVCVPRQNGKGSILEARELAGLFIFGERTIIHSAHEFGTSMEAFDRILLLIESTPDLEREVARVSRSNGKEGIELKNGQRLLFKARTKGGGRGFTADCIVLDEAMYLTPQQISAMLPTLSARPNGQVWITGSAGTEESEHFGRMRARALGDDADPRLFWAEWSCDLCTDYCINTDEHRCEEHDQRDDPRSYAKANPGLGIRITVETCDTERRSMIDEEFDVERLGVGRWPVSGEGWRVISKDSWMARVNESSAVETRMMLGIDTAPDCKMSTIAVCGRNEDGMEHLEITGKGGIFDNRPGTGWVVDRAEEIVRKHRAFGVVVDPASQAGQFITELEARGIRVYKPNQRQFAQACGDFKTAVAPRKGETATIRHLDQAPLNAALAVADTRPLENMWAWSRKESTDDITPLVAATLARWGFKERTATAFQPDVFSM